MNRTIGDYTFNSNECISQGTYGNLHKGVNKITGQQVMLRLIQKNLLKDDKLMATALTEEMNIMQKLKHPKINPILEVIESGTFFYLITPLQQSNLQEILKQQGKITEQTATKLLIDLADGFSELIKQGIIHRDLKPSNILQNQSNFMISDPGFLKTMESFIKNKKVKPKKFLYLAPQVLENKQKYSNKCDIWSLGAVLYECLFGIVPYNATSIDDYLKLIKTKKLEIPQTCSQNMRSFLEGCLVYQEEKRFDWQKVFSHPIINFKSQDKNEDIEKNNKKYLITQIRQKIIKKNYDIQELYHDLDANGNGMLDFEEFQALIYRIDKKVSKEDCFYIFQQIDKDGSNSISFDEFKLWISGNNTRMALFKFHKNPPQQQQQQQQQLNPKNQPNQYNIPNYNVNQGVFNNNNNNNNQINQFQQQQNSPIQGIQSPLQNQPNAFQNPPQQLQNPQMNQLFMNNSNNMGGTNLQMQRIQQAVLLIKQTIKDQKLNLLHLFQQFDRDKDNFLNYQEFCQLILSLNQYFTLDDATSLFKIFSINNDQQISFVEFRLGLTKNYTQPQFQQSMTASILNYINMNPQQPIPQQQQQFGIQQQPIAQFNNPQGFQNPIQFQNPNQGIMPNQNPAQFFGPTPIQNPLQSTIQGGNYNQPQTTGYPINNLGQQKQKKSKDNSQLSQLNQLQEQQQKKGGNKKDKQKDQEKSKSKSQEKDKLKDKEKELLRDKERIKEKERERERQREIDLERERFREREREREREWEKEKRERERERQRREEEWEREKEMKRVQSTPTTFMPIKPPNYQYNEDIIGRQDQQKQVTYSDNRRDERSPKEEIMYKSKNFSPINSTNPNYDFQPYLSTSKLDPDLTESTPFMLSSQVPANFNNKPYRKVIKERIDNFYYSRR